MLVHLSVHNYAIVEHLDLELDRGMSVITGETGAGKSIMLDATGLTTGDRADSGVVRPGADKADIPPRSTSGDIPEAQTRSKSATSTTTAPASCAGSSRPKVGHAPISMAHPALRAT